MEKGSDTGAFRVLLFPPSYSFSTNGNRLCSRIRFAAKSKIKVGKNDRAGRIELDSEAPVIAYDKTRLPAGRHGNPFAST